jgi:hypothetical protein
MRFNAKARTLLSVVAAAAAISAIPVGTAVAGTHSADCGVMNIGYQGATGCFSSTTVDNNNWTIVNATLQVTGSYGWVSTFTFQSKLSKKPGVASTASGTVTDTTEYGTSTISFTAPAGAVPFGVAGNNTKLQGYWPIAPGNIWADGSSPQGQALFNAQYAMVYNLGGQNAGYWFGGM